MIEVIKDIVPVSYQDEILNSVTQKSPFNMNIDFKYNNLSQDKDIDNPYMYCDFISQSLGGLDIDHVVKLNHIGLLLMNILYSLVSYKNLRIIELTEGICYCQVPTKENDISQHLNLNYDKLLKKPTSQIEKEKNFYSNKPYLKCYYYVDNNSNKSYYINSLKDKITPPQVNFSKGDIVFTNNEYELHQLRPLKNISSIISFKFFAAPLNINNG